jgi:hypothetical protein
VKTREVPQHPDSWTSFFELADRAGVPDDFMSDRRDEAPQERDLF